MPVGPINDVGGRETVCCLSVKYLGVLLNSDFSFQMFVSLC